MSDGFELGPFHVPQQSRRDKLRSVEGCAGLHHLYDPLLLCTAGDAFLHPTYPLSLPPAPKQEPLNAVSLAQAAAERHEPFFSFSSSSTSTSSHPLLDLPPSVNINPSNPFLYAAQEPQNLRDFDQPFHDCRGAFKPAQAPPQGLSLSLSSQSFGGDPCVLTEKGMESYVMFDGDMWRSTGPLGPFTGYAEVLKGSRFLKPAQQLLEGFCDVGKRVFLEGVSAVDVEMERWSNSAGVLDNPAGIGVGGDGGEQRRKKSRLISMLDEVYRRYKIYYQQMQTVVASFESVHGLSNAAPYASFALKTLSKHFRAIKNAITDQIRTISNSLGEELGGKEGTPKFRIVDERLHQQKDAHGMGVHEQPHVWRPQRGLPERAVAVLRAWLFEHFLHPYPTDSDKQMLAKQTGLSRSQVSNWFINARVRLWKPMVEEIHSLEMRQKVSGEEDQHTNRQGALTYGQDEQLCNTTLQRDQEPTLKRFGNEFSHIPDDVDESMDFSYNGNLSNHHLQPTVAAGGNTGVSLTLGLHQNNGACLSQPLPLTHVANFGMGDGNSTYGIAGFGSQNRQFGRNIGGQLLYDFVG